MKFKTFLMLLILLMILAAGCSQTTPQQSSQLAGTAPSAEKTKFNNQQTTAKDDFGCFYSCDYFPAGLPKQMCSDWKAGKQVQWPPDCKAMQYEPCIKLCESEKKKTNQTAFVQPDYKNFNAQIPSSPADFLYHTRSPFCINIKEDYGALIIYVRPSDVEDTYEITAPKLKKWIANANGILNTEAGRFNMTADLKVACENGEITALNVKLPNPTSTYRTASSSSEAIIADMKSLGYTDKKIKYVIWFDQSTKDCGSSADSCLGQSSGGDADDRLSEDNFYNLGPGYAILYKADESIFKSRFGTDSEMLYPIIMLHEYSHTLGAVQPSAPHATKKETSPIHHCNDAPSEEHGGTDVMCRSESPDEVFGTACKGEGLTWRFDCNNDDYFNPKPEPGSYLATHWNLGSALNHFFKVGSK